MVIEYPHPELIFFVNQYTKTIRLRSVMVNHSSTVTPLDYFDLFLEYN